MAGNPILANGIARAMDAVLRNKGAGRCIGIAADTAAEAVQTRRILGIDGLMLSGALARDIMPLLSKIDHSAKGAGHADTVLTMADGQLAGWTTSDPMPSGPEDSLEPAAEAEWSGRRMRDAFRLLTGIPAPPETEMAEALALNKKPFPGRIAMIGFMGCGKTRNGRLLAKKLGWRFEDMDDAIEKRAGKRIPDIFADQGEDAFRDIETAVLADMGRSIETVVSCGGGVITRPQNRDLLIGNFLNVWLVASMDTIIARTSRSDRPLLACDDPRARAESLFRQRRMLYAACTDLVVSTEPTSRSEAYEKVHEEIGQAFPD